MTDERRFSVEEADGELDELRRRLPILREARQELIDTGERITSAVEVDGGGVEGSAWFRAPQTLRAELLWLAGPGLQLRRPHPRRGVLPAVRDGRRVFQSWRLGEERVGWFHEEQSGFSGRRPL